jgi:hypothetical protein
VGGGGLSVDNKCGRVLWQCSSISRLEMHIPREAIREGGGKVVKELRRIIYILYTLLIHQPFLY